MPTELIDYDSTEYFSDPEAQAALMEDAIEVGDAGYLAHALGVIARAHGMTQLATETGIKRQALYRALATRGNPTLVTVLKVLKALGLEMRIEKKAA